MRNVTVPEEDKVSIDGFIIDGFIRDDFVCDTCSANIVYYEQYDSEFCPQCNVWKAELCSDPKCEYCVDRPENPLK